MQLQFHVHLALRRPHLKKQSFPPFTCATDPGFDSVRVHMHIIRSFENDVIRQKKMVAVDRRLLLSCVSR